MKFKETKLYSFLTRAGGWTVSVTSTHPFVSCLTAGFVMTLLIYLLHARGLIVGIRNIANHPFFFLFNALIVIATYTLMLLFKRRIFALSFVTVGWLAIGITNCVLLGMRAAPLEGIDFYIVRTGIVLLPTYMSVAGMIATALGILAAIGLLVLLFFKCPRVEIDHVRILLTVICCLLALLLVALGVIGLANADPRGYESIKEANDVYGFPYCFLRSIFERGIDQPENYSEEQLRALVSQLAQTEDATLVHTPNVVFVQLESFFDVNRMKDITYSENPIPNFTALGEEGSRGLLGVSSLGGGTANTEFEVLTGLDLTFFGTGEYPYQSVLGDRCCETVAYNLAALGYTAHGMHNHTGTFYDRYLVYSNLGFDTFTSAEHMLGLTYNELGWEEDAVLTDYIMKALGATEGQDFVFAVSVQGHGGYPEVSVYEDEPPITLSGADSEEWHNAFTYYVNQLHEMDAFIGALCDALEDFGEDTVLVLYGDHLPSVEIVEEQLKKGDLYTTEYVIWSNFELEKTEMDLEAYQLSAFVLEKLGIDTGLINKIHQEYDGTAEYSAILELAGYDMLYGDAFAFGGEVPYTPRDTAMGLDPFCITEVTATSPSEFFVVGEGFTPHSCVFVNDRKIDVTYISENSLFAEDYTLAAGDEIYVAQVSADFRRLAQTDRFAVSSVTPNQP